MYADTDFFLALLKPTDWLKNYAGEILRKYRGEIWTSEVAFIELLLLAKRYGLDPVRLVSSVIAICKVKGVDENVLFLASHYIKKGFNVFDAFHASHAMGDKIISSDDVYDKIGMERIKLENIKRD